MLRKRNGPKCQMSSFSGIDLANHPANQAHQRGDRAGKPFVIAKRRQADQRAAEQTDDPAADQSHQERAFERQIEEAVAAQSRSNTPIASGGVRKSSNITF